MSIELTILRLLKYRDRYEKLHKHVPVKALDAKTQAILADFGAWFKEFPESQRIPQQEFGLWFSSYRHPTLNDEQRQLYAHLLGEVQKDVTPEIEAGLLERMTATALAYDLMEAIEKFQRGEEVDLGRVTREKVEAFEQQCNRKVKVPWVTTTIGELLTAEKNDTGLKWRLSCLNDSMRPLRGGDSVVIAARPDKGKTSFMTDNLTYMAKQVNDMFNGERYVLWFNNEGPGSSIVQRAYQSALNKTIPELVQLHDQPSTKGFSHLLDEQYAEAVGGLDRLRVFDVHDFWNHEVEDIIRKVPAGLIVFDMVDNIKFGGSATNGGERTDQLLEAMYQWARIIAVKYDVPILMTSQISAEGDGMQWPTLGMLKDSKTGKQGAATAIITIGASNEVALEPYRYIGMTKNKLHRSGGKRDPRATVVFDAERGRYNESTM